MFKSITIAHLIPLKVFSWKYMNLKFNIPLDKSHRAEEFIESFQFFY